MDRTTIFTHPDSAPLEDIPERTALLFVQAFDEVQEALFNNAVAHGFWQGPKRQNPLEKLFLVTTEVAEAGEAIRNRTADLPCEKEELAPIMSNLEEEIADTIIRLMDFAQAHGLKVGRAIIAKHEYNRGRPFKHGKTC
ncbi:MAG: hypothetical protein GY906_12905 [bacterium]|nr:hypothetical protein [bacterium]